MVFDAGDRPAEWASSEHDSTELRFLLEIGRGHARQKTRPITGPVFLIGSDSDCDLVLADERFDPIFAYLIAGKDGVTLRCVGEGPEVTIDGRPTRKSRLFDGDRLRIGAYEFRFRIVSPIAPENIGPKTDVRSFKIGLVDREVQAGIDAVESLLAEIHEIPISSLGRLCLHQKAGIHWQRAVLLAARQAWRASA